MLFDWYRLSPRMFRINVIFIQDNALSRSTKLTIAYITENAFNGNKTKSEKRKKTGMGSGIVVCSNMNQFSGCMMKFVWL